MPDRERSNDGVVSARDFPDFDTVYRQMRALAGSGSPDLLDLVQAAAEQVIESRASFEGRCAPTTWTWQICYRTLLKHRRWYRRWLARFTLSHDGELPELQHADASAPDQLDRLERAQRLRQAVARLSPKRRSVVVLHDLEGESIDDIAAIVGANSLTVRSRLRDGRRDLAKLLRDDPYFGDEACSREERS